MCGLQEETYESEEARCGLDRNFIIGLHLFQQMEDAAGETRFEPIQKTSVEAGFRLNF